ncbi:MAG: Hachiman antiphage defense system protein HamA [Anaerovoracaceae bacterium]
MSETATANAEQISGISFTKKSGYALCHFTDLSNEIKELLKKQLSFICYGQSASQSDLNVYNYTNTLKEFLTRYESKNNDKQKGMIGELLSHLVINKFFSEYHVVSPFFNKEERSVKKGFDVVLSSKKNHDIWITEVKSGELHKNKDSDATTADLLATANRDLVDRLNGENLSLWLNAINDAKIVFERHSDLKDAIVEILDGYGSKGIDSALTSAEMNVFLVSALFAPLSDLISLKATERKTRSIESSKSFKALFVLSMQKETYTKIYEFLKEESEGNGKRKN